MTHFENIVVPTDYAPAAQRAADLACELANRFNGRLTLLHVWEVPLPAYSERITVPLDQIQAAAREAMEIELARVRAAFPNVASIVTPGVAWSKINQSVGEHGFDLIVMGTHGRRGLNRVLVGSVAEKVVRTASVPVLTVHASDR